MTQKVAAILFVCFVANYLALCLGCDLYLASKCPAPPTPTQSTANWTLYCKGMKDYVDCINKKLKSCKMVQEYGPAMETIKWTAKVIIQQVSALRYLLIFKQTCCKNLPHQKCINFFAYISNYN
jgi:hypothetical protein